MLYSESAMRIPGFESRRHSGGLLMLQIPALSDRRLSLTSQIVLQLRYDKVGKNRNVLQMFIFADLVQSQG